MIAEMARKRLRVLRSKNAGPFALTFDIVLRDDADFERVRATLSRDVVVRACAVPASDVLGTAALPGLNALKVSILRRIPAGHPGDGDCYGMNQEEPLARLILGLLE